MKTGFPKHDVVCSACRQKVPGYLQHGTRTALGFAQGAFYPFEHERNGKPCEGAQHTAKKA